MGMNIKSDDTHRRAKELARMTGETIAEAVDRGLVDRLGALGGRLEVDSPPGRGTTVRAVVPRDPRADDQAAAGSGSGRPGVAASSALRA